MPRAALQGLAGEDWGRAVIMHSRSPCRGQAPAHSCSACPPCWPLDWVMCFFFWQWRMRVQNLAAVAKKLNNLAFLQDEGCCVWISAALKKITKPADFLPLQWEMMV